MITARGRDLLVVVLAVHSGATDAIGFVALGGAFTSVMTGNLVLTGIGAARGDGELALLAGGAIVLFAVGCVLGARVAGRPDPDDPPWPPAVTRAVGLEVALVLAGLVCWQLVLPGIGVAAGHGLLWTSAAVLGVQSSAVQRFGVPGLSTTYLTGTLTTMVAAIAHGRARTVRLHAALIAALVVGAAIGALCATHVPRLAPVVELVLVGGVFGVAVVRGPALRARRRRDEPRAAV